METIDGGALGSVFEPLGMAAPDGIAGLGFDRTTWTRLARLREVDLETRDPWTGLPLRSPAWIVGVNGRLYVRSRRGARRAWMRHLEIDPRLAVWVDGERIPFAACRVSRDDIIAAVTQEYCMKYGADPDLRRVLHDAAVAATVELYPAMV